ncbi:unnamed protein product, partial [Protopolystoma xenopodis]
MVTYQIEPLYDGQVSSSFATTRSPLEFFSLNPDNGILCLRRQLDFEEQTSHIFWVIASDKGLPSLSSTALVKIIVLDYNDNPPIFDGQKLDLDMVTSHSNPFGIPSCQPTVHFNARASAGSFVTRVSANDQDSSDTLTYRILSPSLPLTKNAGRRTVLHDLFDTDDSSPVIL